MMISIIIPTFNRVLYLKDALNSIFSQTYKKFEIIVIDDGSIDNTAKFVKQFYPSVRYAYQKNKGPASARNHGARLAHGKYLAFLDSDDMWHPQKLEIQMNILNENKNISTLSTIMLEYSDKCTENVIKFEKYQVNSYSLSELLVKQQMATPTAVVNKRIFDSCGGFREDLKLCEDHDLWFRLAEKSPLHKIMLPLAYYRCLGNSLSAGNRGKTHKAYINFMHDIFNSRYPQLRSRLLPVFLSSYYYSMSIEYTETNDTLNALRYLFKSWWHSPLKLNKNYKGKFLRLRRLFVILRNCLTNIFSHKAKEKIIILCSSLDHIKRGVETWSANTFLALKERSIDVYLYKGSGQKRDKKEYVISTLPSNTDAARRIMKFIPKWCWHIGAGSCTQLEQTIFSIKLLPKLLFKRNIILHTQEAHTAFLMQKFIDWGIINAKLILAHGTEEPFEYLSNFKYIQHLAPYHLDEAKRNNVKSKKSFAIPNFVDTTRFHPGVITRIREKLSIPNDAFVVLIVAAVKKTHKRIDYLLKEISLIKDKNNIYLIIAGGKTDETKELVNMGKILLKGRVRFLLDLDRKKMPEIYAAADIFTLSSLKEMMPIALLEALSSGLPCICNKYPVLEWMVGPGGECIDMTQSVALSSVIEKYFNSDSRNIIKKRARKHAVDKFSRNVVIKDIIDMYMNVMGG